MMHARRSDDVQHFSFLAEANATEEAMRHLCRRAREGRPCRRCVCTGRDWGTRGTRCVIGCLTEGEPEAAPLRPSHPTPAPLRLAGRGFFDGIAPYTFVVTITSSEADTEAAVRTCEARLLRPLPPPPIHIRAAPLESTMVHVVKVRSDAQVLVRGVSCSCLMSPSLKNCTQFTPVPCHAISEVSSITVGCSMGAHHSSTQPCAALCCCAPRPTWRSSTESCSRGQV
jgi:hypothetical protein